jgi:hypothetical protein
MGFKRWLQQAANRRIAERRLLDGFAAAYHVGPELRQGLINDISAAGLFVDTRDQFQPGTSVPLMLHRRGSVGADPGAHFVTINARVVRQTGDGVAFAFEIPASVDTQQWISLVDTATNESDSDDIIAPFRFAKALAFLTRICAPNGALARRHVQTEFTGQRLWNAVEILLKAESYLSAFPGRAQLPCGNCLAVRILDEGSWTENAPMMHDWAGLLATACSCSEGDDSGRAFVELFSQLTLNHVRIMNEACTRSVKRLTSNGQVGALPLSASADEIMRFSDSRDLLRMGRALQHLAELGLLEERFKTSMFVPVDAINITPTPLGLLLHARCAGHVGPLESFYGTSVPMAAAG